MTDSKTAHDKEAEQAADKDKARDPENGKDFGEKYAPLDPASHENDPSLTAEQKTEQDKGAFVDTSASTRTSDSDDPSKSWTIQTTDDDDNPVALTEDLGEPGQRFQYHELPFAESVEKWGVDSSQWPKSLPLHEDAEKKVYEDEEKDKDSKSQAKKKK